VVNRGEEGNGVNARENVEGGGGWRKRGEEGGQGKKRGEVWRGKK